MIKNRTKYTRLMSRVTVMVFISLVFSLYFSSKTPNFNKLKLTALNIPPSTGLTSVTAKVQRVIDGDTVELSDGRKVRYIGINAPEFYDTEKEEECYSREATIENRRLVQGKTVRLEKDISDTDKYGRLLRYVYIEETMINETLVRQGFARQASYLPDIKYTDLLMRAENEANDAGRGLWSGCSLNK